MSILETGEVELMPAERRRDSKGRVTLSEARRAELLVEYAASGMSQTAFARRAGVTFSTFAGWVQRMRKGKASPGAHPHHTLKGPMRADIGIRVRTKPQTGKTLKSPMRKKPSRRPVSDAPPMTFREVIMPALKAASALTVCVPGGIEVRCPDIVTAAALVRELREAR